MKALKILALSAMLAIATHTASSATVDIYPEPAQAKADLAAALKTAAATHKRVIIDFGGNWCGDCVVLDRYFHDANNMPIVQANFVVVHINIGHMDFNVDIAEKYGIPLKRGVPALAVLSDHGKLLYSQQTGEFENMRTLQSTALTSFLLQWKPGKVG